MAEYEATFDWPYPAGNVIVTGDFDNWAKTIPLTRSGNGFTGTAKVAYDSTVHFKFVVDGQWLVREDLPKEANNDGIVNNVVRTPPKADATNATHHSEPIAEIAPTVNGIAPSAAEVAAEAGPEPIPEVETSIPAQASATATEVAATVATVAHGLVNGVDKPDVLEAPAATHGDPIKALADATAPSPITAVPIAAVADVAAAAREFVAPTAEPTAIPQVLPVSQPIKDLADATAPSAAVETVQDAVTAAHEFVNGGPLTPAEPPVAVAAEVSQPIKALADATAPPAIIAAPVETVKDLGAATQAFVNGINGGTTAETPVAEKIEAVIPPALVDSAAVEASKATDPTEHVLDAGEDNHTIVAKAAELVIGTAAATSAAVLAALGTEKTPAFEEPATTTTTSEPTTAAPAPEEHASTAGAVASAVASNVGLAIKSLTGVDPINAAQVPIPEAAPAVEVAAPAAPIEVKEVVAAPEPVAVQAGTASAPPVEPIEAEAAPAPAVATPTTPEPVTPTKPKRDSRFKSKRNSTSSAQSFPASSSAQSTPSKLEGGERKRNSSIFGKIKGVFHKGGKGENGSPKK